ncbi:vanadium-dependent haloperoxidase [Jejudonia soesokkakensis]|uniref:Vanadium-dependent haloperoxidase n=1 Tax=Jejudonia soesokkakensis TaxID=1323432 RepID=A0ABW2MSD5_9FLAO
MKFFNSKTLLITVLAVLVLQSCSNDDNIDDTVADATLTIDLIKDWNDLWLEVDRHAYGMRPTSTARALAYIHLAGYETALADMDGYTSNQNRLENFTVDANQRAANVDLNLALSTTYAVTMDHFMLNVDAATDAKIGQLKATMEADLSLGLSNSEITNSIAWGTYVANQVIAYSQTDIAAEQQIHDPQPISYVPPVGPGYWTFSADPERALFPYWGEVRTFVISSDQTTSVAPNLTYSTDPTSDYYAEMNEVYLVNNEAKLELNDDLWIAEFWSDDVEGMMMSPPGRMISIANQLVVQNDLSYERTLAMFLRLGFSLNDAAVSAWADKYEYMVMRPSVYIQEHIDPDFETNLYRFIYWPNPSFPGYPSGHSTFASAAAGIFINEFGDTINFTDRTHEGRTEFGGTPREYNSLSSMAQENAYSRIPLGVHMRMDCTEGYRLGYEISDAVIDFDLNN